MDHVPLGYSIAEATKVSGGLSRATLYRLVRQGKLELVKIGGRAVVTRRSLERLLLGQDSQA